MWPLLKKFSYFSTGQVTHYNATTFEKILLFFHWASNPLQCDHFLKNHRIFLPGQVTHYNVTTFEKSSLLKIFIFPPWAALQCDHFWRILVFFLTGPVTHYNVIIFEKKSSYFSTGQVTHYNMTTFEKSSYFPPWAGNSLQCDQFEKFSYFFKHQAGHLKKN